MHARRVADWRIPDFTVIARYKLGWIPDSNVAVYPATTTATLRALNEGPNCGAACNAADMLTMIVPCSFCASNVEPGSVGGHLYLSLRVRNANAR